ncbi:hypothetical protein D3C87_1097980 [compost metagenome]
MQIAETFEDVAAETLAEGLKLGGVPEPVLGGQLAAGIRNREALDVARGRHGPADGVILEARLEVRIGELLGQDGGDPDGETRHEPFGGQAVQHGQEGEVGLGDRLIEVFLAEGPHARLAVVRQVRMQDDADEPVPHDALRNEI